MRYQLAIDARTVFRAYVVMAGIAGFLIVNWGPTWFGTDLAAAAWGKAALIRVFGSILIGAACCAVPFALHGTPSLRWALFWFGAGHAAVYVVMKVQQSAIWGPGIGYDATRAVGALSCLLIALFLYDVSFDHQTEPAPLTTLFGGRGASAAMKLRSQYEQQIQQAARQEERNRLARDLHDSIKQQVFVVQTAAATAQTRFDADPAGARHALDQIRDAAREAMTEMQAMLDQLRAEPLGNQGLVEAIRKQCEALQFRTGAKVEFEIGELPPVEAMPPSAPEALLRVVQESLANIGRHARAGNVQIVLGQVNGQVQLGVTDDGAGFDPNQIANGLDLGNMRARAEEIGGAFEIASEPGRGTTMQFAVPFAAPAAARRRQYSMLGALLIMLAVTVLAWRKAFGLTMIVMIVIMAGTRAFTFWYQDRARRAAKGTPR